MKQKKRNKKQQSMGYAVSYLDKLKKLSEKEGNMGILLDDY